MPDVEDPHPRDDEAAQGAVADGEHAGGLHGQPEHLGKYSVAWELLCTPHTVVLRKTRKMHIKNYKHLAAAFYMVIHMQKEFKFYLSIQLRSGYFGIISNLAPFMMTLQQGA